MSLATEIQADMAEIEADLGDVTFVITNGAVPVKCVATSLETGTQLALGGDLYNVSLRLICTYADLLLAKVFITPRDLIGDTVTFRAESYKVVTARRIEPSVNIELILGDLDQ